jgi:hypothetical protein
MIAHLIQCPHAPTKKAQLTWHNRIVAITAEFININLPNA